jgi:hypothetical protein
MDDINLYTKLIVLYVLSHNIHNHVDYNQSYELHLWCNGWHAHLNGGSSPDWVIL